MAEYHNEPTKKEKQRWNSVSLTVQEKIIVTYDHHYMHGQQAKYSNLLKKKKDNH